MKKYLLLLIGILIFWSCQKEEKKSVELKDLQLSAENIELFLQQTAEVEIISGNGIYSVLSENQDIVTAIVENNAVKITSVNAGKTSLEITDTKSQKKKTLAVVVRSIEVDADGKLLKFSKEEIPENGKIEIPQGVKIIAKGVFKSYQDLTEVVLNSVQIIEDEAFHSCQSLEKITLNEIKHIGKNAFAFNAELKTILINTTQEFVIDTEAFASCAVLEEITLPETTTEIKSKAFFSCRQLRSVRVKATTPPKMSRTAFNFTNREKKLIVPHGSKDAYQQTEWGRQFSVIEEE